MDFRLTVISFSACYHFPNEYRSIDRSIISSSIILDGPLHAEKCRNRIEEGWIKKIYIYIFFQRERINKTR